MIRLLLALAVIGLIYYAIERQMSSSQQSRAEEVPEIDLVPLDQDASKKSNFYQTEMDKARSVEKFMQQASQRELDEQ